MKFQHSKGLALLFTTEMWERFSFYTVRALLVYYLTAAVVAGGLGWSRGDAVQVYGTYIAIAYLMPILGGYLSDRYLGQRRSAMIGGFLMAVGHFVLALSHPYALFSALGLIAVGNGFFKPCLTSILGEMYEDADESQRDSGYSLFYMGINLGAILSTFIGGWLMTEYGYDAGFVTAGFAMVIGLVIFAWGKKRYLGTAGIEPQGKKSAIKHTPLSLEEKKRLGVVFFLFIATLILFIAWDQMGGIVPLFIQESVDLSFGNWQIPAVWVGQIDPLFIVVLAPLLSILWTNLGQRDLDLFVGAKIGLGFLFMSLAFFLITTLSQQADGGASVYWTWIILYKLLVVMGEVLIIPISWAAVSKLSPERYLSRSMGLMLAGVGIGSYLAGYVGSFIDTVGTTPIFYGLTVLLLFTGVLCFILNPKLKRLAHCS